MKDSIPPGCPGVGSMEKKAWNSWRDHGFPMLPMLPLLFHAMQKHGKAWEYFSGYTSRTWNSWDRTFLSFRITWKSLGSMEQYFLTISDSMEKHGEHGTAFSHDFGQHGKAWGAW